MINATNRSDTQFHPSVYFLYTGKTLAQLGVPFYFDCGGDLMQGRNQPYYYPANVSTFLINTGVFLYGIGSVLKFFHC